MIDDVVEVSSSTVACEGNGPVSGHPRVYLTFKAGEKQIVCPYCSRTFTLAAGAKAGQDH